MQVCFITGPLAVSIRPGMSRSIHSATRPTIPSPSIVQSLESGSQGQPACNATLISPGNSIAGVPYTYGKP
ncbi:hypothetical protein IEQ34_012188 [Dendrobium chrysotoxum]|uniref:Uncharacterized protein n=1 Tax=Dendrobium chrysotoxum TaxID=161865 RepID=A0AAV7GC71_DENCH|nr:hypothetical protein IEQ34_012188 [Dendrobium chrysotoxum]